DAAAATAPAVLRSATAPTARAGAEAESAGTETPAETGPEAGPEARAERPVVAGGVTADGGAAPATGLPAGFREGTPCMRVEAEALGAGASGERPAFMREWVVHM